MGGICRTASIHGFVGFVGVLALARSIANAQPATYYADDAGIRVISPAPDTDFARPLAAGDFDGDGADDLAIGQSETYPEGVAHVWIVRGEKARWSEIHRDLDLAVTTPSLVIQGDAQTINLPTSLATGDINGDGFDDLAMTAPNLSPRGRANAGVVYVVLGGVDFYDRPTTLTLTEPGNAKVITFDGAVANGDLGGQSVFGGLDAHGLAIGDLNGDGIDDMAVGAHLADPKGRGDAGHVTVMLGRTTFVRGQEYDLALADFRVEGARQYYETGTQLLIADVTGDSIGELIIGCDMAGEDTFFLSSEGIVYVLRGRTTWPTLIDLLTTWDLKIRGVTDGVGLGSSLAAADMNQDGILDLCLGAVDRWYGSSSSNGIGAIEIHYGKPTLGVPPSTIRPASPDILWMGPEVSSYMGYEAVSGRFDLSSRDGLFASAVFADAPPESTNGFVEGLKGREDWTPNAVLATQLSAQHNYRIVGPDQGRFGFALTAADTNGDNIDEVVVGAPFQGKGEIYVYQMIDPAAGDRTTWLIH